ncbi:MAG: oligosaccharide flippase family protein [Geminicoccaceae bacterium]|nr:oligosaccharide flippase family protein [Geminicoccaceae bacterium]
MTAALPVAPLLARLGVLGGARALAAFFGFLAMLELAPAAGPETLGRWSMVLAVQGWLLHLAEWGLRSVVTAEAGRTAGGGRALLPNYLGVRLALAGLLVVGALGVTAVLAPDRLATTALVLSSLIAIALQLDWLALVEDRPILASFLLLVRPIGWWMLLVPLEPPLTLERLAALFAASWALAAVASWLVLGLSPKAARGTIPPASPRRLLRRGFPLMLVTLANQAIFSADTFLVGAVLGPERAGAYYLASALATAALVVANATNQLALARAGALSEDPLALAAERSRQLRIATALALCSALALALAVPLLPSLFGSAFDEARAIAIALAPWVFLQHPSAVLRAFAAADRDGALLVLADLALCATFLFTLPLALVWSSPVACALARSLGELARLALLSSRLRGRSFATRPATIAEFDRMPTLPSGDPRALRGDRRTRGHEGSHR